MIEKITKIEHGPNGVAIYRGCVFCFVTEAEASQMRVGDDFESTPIGRPVQWIKVNGKIVRDCRTPDDVTALLRAGK